MFRKTRVTKLCDNLCQAARLREQTLVTLALQGPRI